MPNSMRNNRIFATAGQAASLHLVCHGALQLTVTPAPNLDRSLQLGEAAEHAHSPQLVALQLLLLHLLSLWLQRRTTACSTYPC